MMRERLARAIVRRASHHWGAAYAANGVSPHDEARHADRAGRWARLMFPLARRLDRESMGDQMAQEGWWG